MNQLDSYEKSAEKTKRIARNTLILYVRTFLTMLVSLYTSRVLLGIIGVDNYGIYNVVGGIVGLFSLISGSLVNAISRYITYTLGTGDEEKLRKVFSSSVIIQGALSLLLIIISETVGLWFLYNELNIPFDRLNAAFWVFQTSIFGSVLGLLVIPYNACIVSHERMGVYAYFSIIEVIVKLILIYFLALAPIDKLVGYAMIILFIAGVVQFINVLYCRTKFSECKIQAKFEKELLKEMSNFAGWNFLGNAANVANFQGINILLNIFFGVAVNAAQGIVAQVEQAIKKFVTSFMMAINPQITKSYAQRDFSYLKSLISMSSRYGFYLFMLLGLPVFIEAKQILNLWLTEVPEDTTIFLRLSMVISVITIIGDASYNVMMATGQIKKFQIIAAVSGLMVIPITYILYKMGMPAYFYFLVMIVNYGFVVWSRISLLKPYIGDIRGWFVKNVFFPITLVVLIASSVPFCINMAMNESLVRLILVVMSSFVSSIVAVYTLGMTSEERIKYKSFVLSKIRNHYLIISCNEKS